MPCHAVPCHALEKERERDRKRKSSIFCVGTCQVAVLATVGLLLIDNSLLLDGIIHQVHDEEPPSGSPAPTLDSLRSRCFDTHERLQEHL